MQKLIYKKLSVKDYMKYKQFKFILDEMRWRYENEVFIIYFVSLYKIE